MCALRDLITAQGPCSNSLLSISLSPPNILGRSEDEQWVAEGVTQQEVEEAEDSKEFEGTR